jgi:peptidoglycan/LPS O-acetylase OafA/YrhL
MLLFMIPIQVMSPNLPLDWRAVPFHLCLVQCLWPITHPTFYNYLNVPSWSISCEWFFYLVAPLAMFCILNRSRRWVPLVASAAYACGLGLFLAHGQPDFSRLYLVSWFAPSRLPEFLTGVYLARVFLEDGGGRLADRSVFMQMFGIGLVVVGAMYRAHAPWPFWGGLLYVPGAAVLILGLAYGRGFIVAHLSRPWMRRLGMASFCLYLLQAPILRVAKGVCMVLGWSVGSWSVFWAVIAGMFVLIQTISLLVHRFYELPAQKQLRRLGNPPNLAGDRAKLRLCEGNGMKLKSGDWVEVKTSVEVAETLGPDGTLDGLPFMPEMRRYCGHRFQVLRIAGKTCVEYVGGDYQLRQFRGNDVVLLRDLRCSGADHDGCGRACVLFWKAAWLRPVELHGPSGDPEKHHTDAAPHCRELLSKLRTKTSSERYICQSTQLNSATQAMSRVRILTQCLSDLISGSRSIFEMMRLTLVPLWRKATRWVPQKRLAGTAVRTPAASLGLQPGEWVQIKSFGEIAQTLDVRGRNRGLLCDIGMCRYSGGTYRVRNRLERMIQEPTGEMKQVQNTVILEPLSCLCWNVFGGCPREDFMYWREIWLKRVDPRSLPHQTAADSDNRAPSAELASGSGYRA